MKHLILALVMVGLSLIASCTSSKPSNSNEDKDGAATCTEPENPYDEGTGHHAGYEWAENNSGTCGGSSQSFTEGCEEQERQQAEYEECEAKKKH